MLPACLYPKSYESQILHFSRAALLEGILKATISHFFINKPIQGRGIFHFTSMSVLAYFAVVIQDRILENLSLIIRLTSSLSHFYCLKAQFIERRSFCGWNEVRKFFLSQGIISLYFIFLLLSFPSMLLLQMNPVTVPTWEELSFIEYLALERQSKEQTVVVGAV